MQNQINMIKGLLNKGFTPQGLIQQMMGNNNNPMISNLMNMMKNGNSQEVENFARNIFKEKR